MRLARARIVNGLLVAVAVALGVALFITRHTATTSERSAREDNVFRVWRPTELDRVKITRDGRTLELTRNRATEDPNAYFLGGAEGPVADPATVSELLSALEFAVWKRRVAEAQVDPERFGLGKAKLEVRVTMGGRDYRLRIGGQAPAPHDAYYAELSGEGVIDPGVGLIAGELVERLSSDFRSFRGKNLLPYAKSELRQLRLEGAGGTRLLVADGRGFRLGSPDGPRADSEAVDRILFQLARLGLETFLDVPEAEQALFAQPKPNAGSDSTETEPSKPITVVQVPKQGEPIEVRVGGVCPQDSREVVALRVGTDALAGCVPRNVLPALSMTADEIEDRTPFPLGYDEIDHVAIREGSRELELIRSGAQFKLLEPEDRPLELDAGNDFVRALVETRGDRLVGVDDQKLEELGLTDPAGTVTVRGVLPGEGDPVEFTVAFSAPRDGMVYLRREDDGVVLSLGERRAWVFTADPGWARSRALVDVKPEDVSRVEVDATDLDQTVIRGEANLLELTKPAGFEIDGGLASDWVSALASLRAVRWLTPEETGSFGTPRLRVRMEYERDREKRTLAFAIGPRTRGGFVARLLDGSDDAPYFVVQPGLVRALETPVVTRQPMTPDVDGLEKLVITAGPVRQTLEKRGGVFISAEGDLDQAAIESLLNALREVRPIAAVHIGPPRPSEDLASPVLKLEGTVQHPGRPASAFEYRFGGTGTFSDLTVQFGRARDVDATYAFERRVVQALLDLF